eukprot:scaffold417_cov252-Pinguiococcus_pyrenoidosus.AAC.30
MRENREDHQPSGDNTGVRSFGLGAVWAWTTAPRPRTLAKIHRAAWSRIGRRLWQLAIENPRRSTVLVRATEANSALGDSKAPAQARRPSTLL